MYNATFPDKLTGKKKIAHGVLIGFGMICGGLSAWYSAIELLKAFHEAYVNTKDGMQT